MDGRKAVCGALPDSRYITRGGCGLKFRAGKCWKARSLFFGEFGERLAKLGSKIVYTGN
jgi:hypothetical protein